MAGKVSSEMAPEACCRPEQVLEIVANVFAGPKQDTAVMAGTPAAHIAAWGALGSLGATRCLANSQIPSPKIRLRQTWAGG